MRRSHSLLLTSLVVAPALLWPTGSARAAQILAITNNGEQLTVTYENTGGRAWKLNEELCVVFRGEELACGYVGRMTATELVVQVTVRAIQPRGGMTVQLRRDSRQIASAQALTAEVRRGESRIGDVSLGMSAGFNYFYPMVQLSVALGRKFSLGLQPLYLSATINNVGVKALGGFLNLNYYLTHYAFRGLILQGGIGLYDMTVTQGALEEKARPLALQAQLLWRARAFSPGIDVGLGAGVLYVGKKTTGTVPTDFGGVLPLLTLFLAYSF